MCLRLRCPKDFATREGDLRSLRGAFDVLALRYPAADCHYSGGLKCGLWAYQLLWILFCYAVDAQECRRDLRGLLYLLLRAECM